MAYEVITIGDATQDIFVRPYDDKFCSAQINVLGDNLCFRHGEKITSKEIFNDVGGSATNVAVGLKKLGINSNIMSIIGDDESGKHVLKRLDDTGLSQGYLTIDKNTGTSTSIVIVFANDRTIFVYRGEKDYKKFKSIRSLKTKWLYLGPVNNDFSSRYNDVISLASEKNVQIALNPGNRQIENGRNDLLRLIKVTNLLILNKQEALDLTKSANFTDNKKLLYSLKVLGPKLVVVTDGANGAYLFDGEKYIGVDKYPNLEFVDSTGAGDAFSAGFLAGYIKSGDYIDGMQYGIINSAMVLEALGAQTNQQTNDQITELLKKNTPRIYKM
jgi:sugar/nucleoside kinase (ribokinase family)